ncbi:L-threonylcarbamoyladenylate synthase [Candidatus Saccharibacteria bacterium]|nr:L-threonylcarbamoyladenylate synthase [Candidatus Saccharibacteria bacterium]MDQ5885195.1 L-threonylcarbamoyladenylate synthase [Patescibacteria group bacterium]MDQ5953653.1 L-threonylcarbamoyladenylate synthase [Patescibacteria group bacterium]MDQ5958640.1 L-threonylcarbamoyladenylate synthase [Patescibacteria group bacterium]
MYKLFDNLQSSVEIIKSGGVGIIKTDTIYGFVACAFNISAVERVYQIKHRSAAKKCIILAADYEQLKPFNIDDYIMYKEKVNQYWPGPYSLVLPIVGNDFSYLTLDAPDLAFRVPQNEQLTDYLSQTGPLIAPSANLESEPTVESAIQAEKIFKDSVDFIVDGGTVKNNKPSTLINMISGDIIR